MDKKIRVLAVLFLFIGCVSAKAQIYLDSLNSQSKAMLLAFRGNDFNGLLTYTHPKIILIMGGVDSALTTLKMGVKIIEESGLSYVDIKNEKPEQLFQSGQLVQCLLPQTSDVMIKDKKIKAISYLLCISYNGGKNWYFINANKEKETQLKKLIPEINKKLVIPEMQIINDSN
ncbi:hypothetical protein [Pedobacter sp. CFBP9032]|uniref:hypothetical protein n=1 Tax=Pedobacter sp. CFBP9032 TaxID=3096539 RepID=UPI002A699B77|nr:hypothetical protein [Pedobacter sp. CFBP9032]MDY0905860.1 hypothetical protein [Pedobacter sp. CFBP9032]